MHVRWSVGRYIGQSLANTTMCWVGRKFHGRTNAQAPQDRHGWPPLGVVNVYDHAPGFFFMTARTLDGPGVVYWTIPSQRDNYARIGKEFYDRINIRAPWNGHGWPPPGMVNV